jgi:hypothetical protein
MRLLANEKITLGSWDGITTADWEENKVVPAGQVKMQQEVVTDVMHKQMVEATRPEQLSVWNN